MKGQNSCAERQAVAGGVCLQARPARHGAARTSRHAALASAPRSPDHGSSPGRGAESGLCGRRGAWSTVRRFCHKVKIWFRISFVCLCQRWAHAAFPTGFALWAFAFFLMCLHWCTCFSSEILHLLFYLGILCLRSNKIMVPLQLLIVFKNSVN